MSTIPQNNKRETKQIRVSIKIHRKLKFKAVEKDITISKLADCIIDKYLKNKE